MGHLKRLKVMKSARVSCSTVFWTPRTVACQAPLAMEFSRQEYTEEGSHSFLQGLFLTQRLETEPESSALLADSLPSEPPPKL